MKLNRVVSVYGALWRAVHAVYDAVFMTVYGAMGRAVDGAVYRAVYRAVYEAMVNDPPHPSLHDFLTHTGAETT